VDDYTLTAAFVAALFFVGLAGLAAPRRLLWPPGSALALGMSERTRAAVSRGVGLILLLLSLWLAWRLFGAAGRV